MGTYNIFPTFTTWSSLLHIKHGPIFSFSFLLTSDYYYFLPSSLHYGTYTSDKLQVCLFENWILWCCVTGDDVQKHRAMEPGLPVVPHTHHAGDPWTGRGTKHSQCSSSILCILQMYINYNIYFIYIYTHHLLVQHRQEWLPWCRVSKFLTRAQARSRGGRWSWALKRDQEQGGGAGFA